MPRISVTQAESMMRDNLRSMRAEYTRMRDIAQKRIARLGRSEFSESSAYRENRAGFAKLKDLDPRDFAKAFSELSKFISAKGSTVTGQKEIRAKTIRAWQEQGLSVNISNYNRVIKILEELRAQKIVYGSDKIVELADATLEMRDSAFSGIILDHLEELLPRADELTEIPGLAGYDFDEIMDLLGD